MTFPRYSVIGLGKLGASMAACIASKGFHVIGVDTNPHTVDLVNAGQAPVVEPGLNDLIAAHRQCLRATDSYDEAIKGSDVTFIVVPTPSNETGAFSLRYVAQAARQIGRALAEKDGYHNVVLTSTVLPGSTQYSVQPILERESGKVCGRDFGLCYSPEFIALSSVIRDFLNPDFVLIGECDERAGSELAACYQAICDNNPPIARMSLVNAELTKIAVNTFVTTKITFANMLAELCEQLPGGDVDVVTAALGLDSRIGRRYLTGGLGYGGPCFPRDNVALAYLARQLGHPAGLAESTDQFNRALADRLVDKVRSRLHQGAVVAVLGLSYKPDSCVVEESQGLYLVQQLTAAGMHVSVYDPLAMADARRVLGDDVYYAETPQECLAGAHAVVIANPDKEFRSLSPANFARGVRPVVVFDCWRLLRAELEGRDGIEYVALGVGNYDANLVSRLADLWRDSTMGDLEANCSTGKEGLRQ